MLLYLTNIHHVYFNPFKPSIPYFSSIAYQLHLSLYLFPAKDNKGLLPITLWLNGLSSGLLFRRLHDRVLAG